MQTLKNRILQNLKGIKLEHNRLLDLVVSITVTLNLAQSNGQSYKNFVSNVVRVVECEIFELNTHVVPTSYKVKVKV